jgi:hypothetical protein
MTTFRAITTSIVRRPSAPSSRFASLRPLAGLAGLTAPRGASERQLRDGPGL